MELVKRGEVLFGYKASLWLKHDLRPGIAQRESLWACANYKDPNPYNLHNRPGARIAPLSQI